MQMRILITDCDYPKHSINTVHTADTKVEVQMALGAGKVRR